MKRKIINCINTIEEFNRESYDELNIGVEVQDFVEPNLNNVQITSTINGYKEMFKDFNNIKALHGPFLDLKPASPDKDIRRVSQEKYFNTLEIAEKLEVNYVIFHSQTNPLLNEPEIKELNFSQNASFINYLMEETPYRGIVLIENIFEKKPIDILRLMEKIESDRVRVNLDIGHAKLSDTKLEDWIRELKDYIAYIHFHSNNGIYDQHKSPSNEEIEILYNLLDKYNIESLISLEYKKLNLEEEIKRFKE